MSGTAVGVRYRARRVGRAVALALALGALPADAQELEPRAPAPPLPGEPLDNDAFVEVSSAASDLLLAGDRLLEQAERDAGSRAALEVEAFESWRQALDRTEVGDAVAWWASAEQAADGAPIAVEGVEAALERRLRALSPERAAAWRARFEPLWAGVAAPLFAADEARRTPGTRGACRFELAQADFALARGERLGLATHARRALVQARLIGDPQLIAAARARTACAARLDRPASDVAPATPTDGTRPLAVLELARLALGSAAVPDQLAGPAAAVEGGLLGGLCTLSAGRLAIQGPFGVLLVDPLTARGSGFDPGKLLPRELGSAPIATATRSDPPWMLEPRSRGDELLLIEGRPRPGDAAGNAVLFVHCPAPDGSAESTVLGGLPELRWALRGDRWATADAEVAEPTLLEGLAEAEYQPGPRLVHERTVVQARRSGGSTEAFLIGLDTRTGEPRWRRLLAAGNARQADAGRLKASSSTCAPPLAGHGGYVISVTGLGTVALHEALDGRLVWSVRHRRRTPGAPTFSGLGAFRAAMGKPEFAPDASAAGPDDPGDWILAPPDSDRLLSLPEGPLAAPTGALEPYGRPAMALPGARALHGAGPGGAFLTRRSGTREALLRLDLDSGARLPAVQLPAGESWSRAPGAWSDGGLLALASGRAVYVFDNRSELRLVASAPWLAEAGTQPRAPRVAWIGDRLVALGANQLCIWTLEVD